MPFGTFYAELKRRRVFRVAVVYAVVAWLVIQVAETVFPPLGLPDWTVRFVILLALLGFPIALVMAWALELTPEGLRLTHAVDQEADRVVPSAHWGWKRHTLAYLAVTLAGGAVVLGVVRWQPHWLEPVVASTALPGADVAPAPSGHRSIAVLPFVNMSEDKANEHFGDGLSEELLNLLAKVPELKVAARTSSFSFKGKDVTIADIADQLGVDTVLEGSVRRSGNTVRVVAQLISAKDGTHLWSEKYDREMSDIFQVQDDIADNILAALMPHLAAGSASAKPGIDPVLYERFLRARSLYYEYSRASLKLANQEFRDITAQAPGYAPAQAWLALSWLMVEERNLGDEPASVAHPAAQAAIDAALAADPSEALALLAQSQLQFRRDDAEGALATIDRALVMNPNLVDAHLARQVLLVDLGRADEAVAVLEKARKLDPLHPDLLWELTHLLNLQGRTDEAFRTLDTLESVNPSLARALELHLFADLGAVDYGAYIGEQGVKHHPDDKDLVGSLVTAYEILGLHQAIIDTGNEYRAPSLALLGRADEARALNQTVLAEIEDPALRTWHKTRLEMALGDHPAALAALLEQWNGPGQQHVGQQFSGRLAALLAALLLEAGREAEAAPVVEAFDGYMASLSPLHQANLDIARLNLLLIRKDTPAALAQLEKMTAGGYSGTYAFNTPFPLSFLVADDPAFADVLARVGRNHAERLANLDRLRQSGKSAREARTDFLAQHAKAAKP